MMKILTHWFHINNIYNGNTMEHKKHKKIVKDYDSQKSKHLEKLATQLIVAKDKSDKLKEKQINKDVLNIFFKK